MKPSVIKVMGLASTLALVLISALQLAGFQVPFGVWLVATLVLLAVTCLELPAVWGPAARK